MKRVLITGGAGFLGSHLCDRFIKEGYHVIAMDNLITGDLRNIEHLFKLPNFEFYHQARLVPLDGRAHLPVGIRQIDGDSRGRWEGNTLVVETTNFSSQSMFLGSAENLHLTERWTRVSEAPLKVPRSHRSWPAPGPCPSRR